MGGLLPCCHQPATDSYRLTLTHQPQILGHLAIYLNRNFDPLGWPPIRTLFPSGVKKKAEQGGGPPFGRSLWPTGGVAHFSGPGHRRTRVHYRGGFIDSRRIGPTQTLHQPPPLVVAGEGPSGRGARRPPCPPSPISHTPSPPPPPPPPRSPPLFRCARRVNPIELCFFYSIFYFLYFIFYSSYIYCYSPLYFPFPQRISPLLRGEVLYELGISPLPFVYCPFSLRKRGPFFPPNLNPREGNTFFWVGG